jgi:hypothetical protein
MRIHLIILALILTCQVNAQSVKATVGTSQILIGDHIPLKLDATTGGKTFERFDLSSIDTSEHFEIVQPGEAFEDAVSKVWQQELVVTSFDSGVFYLPPIAGVFRNANGETETVLSNPIPITVHTVTPDSLGLRPIKDIISEPVSWLDYKWYIATGLGVILLIILINFFHKRKKKDSEEEAFVPYIPPHEKALSALDALEAEEVWQSGDIKQYESRISLIVRAYIEDKFSFPAQEWTTREIMQAMVSWKDKGVSLPVLQDILSQSDMTKFAKFAPTEEALKSQMTRSRKWILSTKDLAKEEE